MTNRRHVVRGLALLVPMTGCTVFENEAENDRIEVDVINISGEPQVVTVEIESDSNTVFEREYDLSENEGDQSQTVEESPETVVVDVAGGRSETFDFEPPAYCVEDPNQEPKVVLTIYDANDVGLTYGCAR